MTSTVLDNGLKVLVQEVHTAPLASVWCWYKVGSKDEVTGLTGVSHWVEHMNFKGTTNIPRDQVKGIIEKFGGSWNGYTWIDQTTYMETASTAGLDRMLFIEAERMANCLYDPDDCESERTVIISELQGSENDPDTLLEQEVIAAAYKVHPYRHPTIGWLSDLRTMSRDDLYQYYRRNYIPNNATVVVVGDVETDDVLRRVEKQFGSIPAGGAPRRVNVVEPEQLGERRVAVSREGTTAYLKLAYHAPAVGDAEFFPMLVLDAILTGAKGINLWSSFRTPPPQRSARLYRALVERRLASSVGAGLLPTEHPFLYLVSATAMEGVGLQDVEAAATEALNEVANQGISERELTKAKNQLRARLVFENDSVTNIGHQLGYFETVASLDAVSRRTRPHRRRHRERSESGGQEVPAKRPPHRRVVHPERWRLRNDHRSSKGDRRRQTRAGERHRRHQQGSAHRSCRHDSGRSAGGQHLRFQCAAGAEPLDVARPRPRHAREVQRADCRSPRRARRVVERRRQPPRHVGQLHMSGGGFRGHARAGRRDRHAAGVSRGRNREAKRRGRQRHPPGRRQPRGHGDADALRHALSRTASVRTPRQRHARERGGNRAERSGGISRGAVCARRDHRHHRGRRRSPARRTPPARECSGDGGSLPPEMWRSRACPRIGPDRSGSFR